MRVLLFSLVLLSLPAHASETPWQELAPDVRLRLISTDVLKPDGTTMVGLELDMPPGTKTYWRVPGESGIETRLDAAGSEGVAGLSFVWPYPLIEQVDGLVDFVYRGPTVLPVELKLTGPSATLEAAVVMGVCSDICVPAIARFTLPLDFARPDRGQGLRIAQAVARAPRDWPAAGPTPVRVSWDASAEALAVRVADSRIDPLSLIADASRSGQLFGAPQKSPDGSAVLLPLLGEVGKSIEGERISLTFMTEMGPFSLSTPVIDGSTADTR